MYIKNNYTEVHFHVDPGVQGLCPCVLQVIQISSKIGFKEQHSSCKTM